MHICPWRARAPGVAPAALRLGLRGLRELRGARAPRRARLPLAELARCGHLPPTKDWRFPAKLRNEGVVTSKTHRTSVAAAPALMCINVFKWYVYILVSRGLGVKGHVGCNGCICINVLMRIN